MSSALFARNNAVLPFTGATDLSGQEGKSVTMSAETATLSASATVVARGIILEGRPTTGKSSIGILGCISGTVRVKLSGTVTKGAALQQSTDGTYVTDAGSGGRVVSFVALESGVSGDLIEAAPFTPTPLS